jgi:hypothetical protein
METQDNLLNFATPIIWHPGVDTSEADVEQMMNRSFATSAWLNNEMDTDSFLDCLDENGVDPVSTWDGWLEGYSYLI